MKTHRILTAMAALTLLACNNSADLNNGNYLTRNLSDFRICDTCVKEDDAIEVIHRTQGPMSNADLDFYYHHIGVRTSTRDTFNFLSPDDPYVNPSDNKRNFSYSMMKVVENLNRNDSVGKIIDTTLHEIKKVAIDKDFSESYLRYPTVRGVLFKQL